MQRLAGIVQMLVLLAAATVSAAGQVETLSCEGPNGTYEIRATVPCSDIPKAEVAAEQYRDAILLSTSNATPEALAGALEDEANRLANQHVDRGTVGPLLGVDRWGCENGFARTNLCDGFVLTKTEPAKHGFSILYEVRSASSAGSASAFDTASTVQWKSAAGDVRIQVSLSLVYEGSSETSAPSGYADDLKTSTRGEARSLLNQILSAAENYQEAYVAALRNLAAQISNPSATETAEPVELEVTVSADGHLPFSKDLNLSSQEVSLVSITGVVTDELGAPIPNAEVRFEGWKDTTRTDAQGEFRLSIFGSGRTPIARTIKPVLQRVEFDVGAEADPASGIPYLGVAADGISTLNLSLMTRGIQSDSVSVRTPQLGGFEQTARLGISVPLDAAGRGSVVYVPPDSIATETLSRPGVQTQPWIVTVPITFDYRDVGGHAGTSTLEIRVCRPPLVLVGGPAADPLLWKQLGGLAANEDFDCRIVQDVAAGASPGLEDSARALKTQLRAIREEYRDDGIKITKIDLIAHGLGGLVARSYVESSTEYVGDVRTLFLMAVPNHGIPWLDQHIAAPIVAWMPFHTRVAQEVFDESEFLRSLNTGEGGGSPLNPAVEYVNLIGRRSALSASPDTNLGEVEDDGVVSTASAHLSGAAEYIFDRTCHVAGLPLPDVPIADSPDVWRRIFETLQEGVASPLEDDTWMEIDRGGGDVQVCREVWTGSWMSGPSFPMPIDAGSAIRTGKGGYAAVGFYDDDGLWGTLSVDENSEVVIRYGSPILARVQVTAGRVRFHMAADDIAHHAQIVMLPSRNTASWYDLQPGVRLLTRGTDVVVSKGDAVNIYALVGRMLIESSGSSVPTVARSLDSSTGVRVEATGTVTEIGVPLRGWWTLGVWRQPTPPFRFPVWLLGIVLAGLAASVVHYLRSRKRWAPRKKPE
jgi:pimeloyl-ACP methyl ester carboxylesterase